MVVVSFTHQEYSVSEEVGSMIVGVQLNKKLQQRIVVRVIFTEDSAEGTAQNSKFIIKFHLCTFYCRK